MTNIPAVVKAVRLPATIALLIVMAGCSTLNKEKQTTLQRQAINLHQVSAQGVHEVVGTVYLSDSTQGLKIDTELTKIPAGIHGFHIHENGSCAAAEKDGKMIAAQAAGGHFNPLKVVHGDEKTGHLGDLPPLTFNQNGESNMTVYAPRLKRADIQGLALMLHAGGDNHSDHPEPLGGGGARIACGVIR
ncbi:superoxide dismutase [Cu-Zn] SodC [Acinetobacter rudis]|uniref:superoxide dismutase [Cu-Zn] SodC n=1 Tax=Acinetobacter rudis TaxID=632955 RepID=UPI0035BE5178